MKSKLLLPALLALAAHAQQAQQAPLTLAQAVDQAVAKYPAIRASMEQVSAAAAAITLARTSYLPRTDFIAQVNRATHNNIFGMLLQQPAISPISGPVLRTNSLGNVWGTAVGLLVSWEPFDFGLRRANVDAAAASRDRVSAQTGVTKLQVAALTADAYLTILAAQQTVTAARAGVERGRVINEVVGTLVKNELRPGVEQSRTQAELALAQTQVIQAERAVAVARASLGQMLGINAGAITLDAGRLLDAAPPALDGPAQLQAHPLAVVQNAAINEVKARQRALNRTFYPKFNLEGTTFARGTGVQPDGSTGNAASGLGPNIQNWGLGLSVTFNPLDAASIRARKEIEQYKERAEAARYRQVIQDLEGEYAKALANLQGARRVAENTPIQLKSARAVEQQATARYKTGLGAIIEVAEAQRLLTQAEIDDALAHLGVWRAMLALAATQGDLAPYLQLTGK